MYLIENNKYYRANGVHLNQEAFHQLSEDGNLTDDRTLDLPVGEVSTDQAEPSQDQYKAHLSTSFVPNACNAAT